MKHAIALLTLIALTLTTSAEEGKKYLISMKRPSTKGEKCTTRMDLSETTTQTIKVEGKEDVVKLEKTEATLSGLIEILAVDAEGKIDKLQVVVEEGAYAINDAEPTQLAKGTVIEGVRKDGEKTYTVDGKAATGTLKKVLGSMLGSTDDKEAMTSDRAFGMDVPRAVGTEWPVDIALLCESMPASVPFVVDGKGSKGTVQFKGLLEHEGREYCNVQADVSLDVTGMKGGPPGLTVGDSTMAFSIKGKLPADPATQGMAGAMEMKMNMDFNSEMVDPKEGKTTLIITARMRKTEEREIVE